MENKRLTREDLNLDTPRSIREIIEDELEANRFDLHENTGEVETVDLAAVDALLKKVYKRIETEAMKRYNSNELWAIKSWTYDNILTDSFSKVAAAADSTLLDQLVAPVKDWQAGEFDPLAYFRGKLQVTCKSSSTICEYMRYAAGFVSRYGKKKRYSEQEIIDFLGYLRQHFPEKRLDTGELIPSVSYANAVQRFKLFLESLPEDENGRKQKTYIDKMPPYPKSFCQPTFTKEEIEIAIIQCLFSEKPEVVQWFAIATIYGTRAGELRDLTPESFRLDAENPTIEIRTEKHGQRKPQPIPKELLPLFSIRFIPRRSWQIKSDLHRICRNAGVPIPLRGGVHSIRRSVVTQLSEALVPDTSTYRFMRWSESGRGLGVLPRYITKPTIQSDREVLDKHPYVEIWKRLMPMVVTLPQFRGVMNSNYNILHVF